MKKLFILFLTFIIITLSHAQTLLGDYIKLEKDFSAQHEVIDTMLIKVEYDYSHNEAPQYNTFLRKDTLFLEIGNQMAHSYTAFEKKMDVEIETKYQVRGRRGHFSFDSRIGEIYSNYPKGEMTVLTGVDCAGVFRYKEKIHDFHWNICNEHKMILKYDCVKAICSFRGRDYEAWFTEALPMSYGPWKFGGLPGLILEIRDSKNEYIFECKDIMKTKNGKITFWNREYKDCTRKEMRKYQHLLHTKPADFTAQYGLKIFNIKGPITNEQWGYERNLIEKE